jgi:hypothetical protein
MEMKMDSDGKFYLGVWALVTTMICTLILSIAITTHAIAVAAFDAGYERVMLPGTQYAQWVKADK